MTHHLNMIKNIRRSLLFLSIFIKSALSAGSSQPIVLDKQVCLSPNHNPSTVTSVDFHPDSRLFCATFPQNNCLVFYRFDNSGRACVFQILQATSSKLNSPQHALFSKDGQSVIVANGNGQTFNLYQCEANGFYWRKPVAVLPFPSPTEIFRPQGMAMSPDGRYLAVALGGAKKLPRSVVALYRIDQPGTELMQLRLLDLLQSDEIETGVPKGIAFSPDGSCLLVTLSETDSVALYAMDLHLKTIVPEPRQVLRGQTCGLSSPGGVRFTAGGDSFAVSNKDTLTFYTYDQVNNLIVNHVPSSIMENPVEKPGFPRGLAFSPDGKYMTVSRFDPDLIAENSNWENKKKDSVTVYQFE